jgi:hypothetical protein
MRSAAETASACLRECALQEWVGVRVSYSNRIQIVHKRQYIRRVILAAKITVQGTAFFFIDIANRRLA